MRGRSEKKVVLFLVEGPSDEAALGSVMKEYFSGDEVRFAVAHGDITLKDHVSSDRILKKVYEQVETVKNRYRYELSDFEQIIHIIDMDGVYVPEKDIIETDAERLRYCEDHIETRNPEAVEERNRRKGRLLFKLRKTGKINGIPYKIYFNSCNLEHVLYGELRDFSDEEKQILSDDFAERYEGRPEEFVDFISDVRIAAAGTYQKTWDFIEKGTNSLNRSSNMYLIFGG